MTTPNVSSKNTSALVLRALPAASALLLCVALFVTLFEDGGSAFASFARLDVFLLLLALMSVGAIITSLFRAPSLMLLVAAQLGSLTLGFAVFLPIEVPWGDLGAGAFLLVLGALGIVAGSYACLVHIGTIRPIAASSEGVLLELPRKLSASDVGTVLVPVSADAASTQDRSPATKVCPSCAEYVKAAAQICRFCGHRFGDTETS